MSAINRDETPMQSADRAASAISEFVALSPCGGRTAPPTTETTDGE